MNRIGYTNEKIEVYLCQYHKAGYNRRGLKALDKLLGETEEETRKP